MSRALHDVPGVLLLFQGERPAADRRLATVPDPLRRVEVQRAEAFEHDALQKASSAVRELVEAALDSAHLTKDSAAREHMRITPSLFGRQLVNEDNQHVSLQRLYLLPDSFWRELLIGIAERRKLARVRRRVIFDGL